MYEFLTKLFGTVDGNPEALTAEQLIQKIEADKTISVVNLKDGGYVSKEKFDAKETELSGVRDQLKEANTKIKSYTDMDIEGIKQSAKDWETKYNTDTQALNAKLAAQERAHQADMFMNGYKFTSKAAKAGVRAEFDAKEFKLENGVFQGAADYMKSLMENEDYKGAFVQEKPDDGQQKKGAGAGGSEPPRFAQGTNGGKGSAGGNNGPAFNFGFQRLREPSNKE